MNILIFIVEKLESTENYKAGYITHSCHAKTITGNFFLNFLPIFYLYVGVVYNIYCRMLASGISNVWKTLRNNILNEVDQKSLVSGITYLSNVQGWVNAESRVHEDVSPKELCQEKIWMENIIYSKQSSANICPWLFTRGIKLMILDSIGNTSVFVSTL